MKFAISEMTALKFFLPLIIEGNKKNINSTLIVTPSNKYNCPLKFDKELKSLSKIYNFQLATPNEEPKIDDVLFVIEGASRNTVNYKTKTISICCSTDFSVSYEKYIDDVDHVVINSKYVSNYYNKRSEKNLYLGSPKFDCELLNEKIIKKYHLDPTKKIATIFYPRIRDISRCPLEKISSCLREMNFEIILKSRKKDPFLHNHTFLADKCLYDESWFPHTSLELIQVSDIIINFSSSVIEEAVALKKPLINFDIKPFEKTFNFLYDFSFVKNVNVAFEKEELKLAILNLTQRSFTNDFLLANETLFDTKTSSKNIIDFILKL